MVAPPRPIFPKPHVKGTCRHCAQPLAPKENHAEALCHRPSCVTRHQIEVAADIGRRALARDAAYHEVSRRRARPVLKAAAAAVGQPDLGRIAHGIAPRIDRPLVPLPDDRRAAFVAHLDMTLEESYAQADGITRAPAQPEHDPDYITRRKEEQPEPVVINASCIACQGECCLNGESRMAFLEVATIDYVRWSRPDLTRDEIRDLYLSHIPETSTSGSCVYHGAFGCTLERNLRADICNCFQCRYRHALMEAYAKKPGHGAVVAGLSADHVDDPSAGAPYLRVVSVSEDHKVRVHDTLRLPGLRKGMPKF